VFHNKSIFKDLVLDEMKVPIGTYCGLRDLWLEGGVLVEQVDWYHHLIDGLDKLAKHRLFICF
jgi:hypothetical protein